MVPSPVPRAVLEPFPVSRVVGRYFLFDVDVIAHCRRTHNICGVLVGTIPTLSQQNVFLGIPLELMPEEARILVENRVAYIVDDVRTHSAYFTTMSREERLEYLKEMDHEGEEIARAHAIEAVKRKDRALMERGLRDEVSSGQIEGEVAGRTTMDGTARNSNLSPTRLDLGVIMKGCPFSESTRKDAVNFTNTDETPLSHPPKTSTNATVPLMVQKHFVTPTTSYPPLQKSSLCVSKHPPDVPVSYPLFRHLHSQGYFHMPGLRFGCHYNVYPGDPLRYHSHFAATGMGWDQEFDLLDIVGGGRLGTGTKKAYMIGGEDVTARDTAGTESVRVFSIEWAAL